MTTELTPATKPQDADNRRARTRHWLWAAGTVLLLAACITRIVVVGGAGPLAEATLADGTILRLETVTSGAQQKLIVQQQSSQILGMLNLQQFRTEISASLEVGEHFPQNGVWLTRRDPQTGEPLDLDWLSHCVAIDADGWEHPSGFVGRCHWDDPIRRTRHQESLVRDTPPFKSLPQGKYKEIVVGAFLPLFQPQAGRFPLTVYNTQGKVVATFEAPYPTEPPARQDWSPVKLPATQSTGDLAVTLERVDFVPLAPDPSIAEKRLPTLKLQPQVRLIWQGQPSDDWKLLTENVAGVHDGLGNIAMLEQCRLTPHVPAWKLDILLWRKPEGRFAPHEEWDSGAIEIPADGESLSLDLQGDVQGSSVQVLKVFGPGRHQFTIAEPACLGQISPPIASEGTGWKVSAVHRPGNVEWTVESERPFVVWKQSPGQTGTLLCRAFDGGGRQLAIDEVYDYAYMNNTIVVIFKELPASGSFSLRPAKSDMRNVSFLIEPVDVDAALRETASVVDDRRPTTDNRQPTTD